MTLKNQKATIEEKMVKLSEAIDEDNEAARLQGSALTGMLLGSWITAAAVTMGYNPFIIATMITIGVVAGLAIRTIA